MNLLGKMMRRHGRWLPIAVLMLLATPGYSHYFWIHPNFSHFRDEGPVWMGFEVGYGDYFPKADHSPGMRWVVVTHPDGEKGTPNTFFGKTRVFSEFEMKQQGTYRLEATQPGEYWTRVDEDGIPRSLPLPKSKAAGKEIISSALYWAKAVAYVSLGKPSDGLLQPQGDPLELIPVGNPSDIKTGVPFAIKVLASGKPLVKRSVVAYAAGFEPTLAEPNSASGHTDDAGVCALTFEKPGRYLVICSNREPLPGDVEADDRVATVYLTVNVL